MSQGATLIVQKQVKAALLNGAAVEGVATEFGLDVSYVRDLEKLFNKKTSTPAKKEEVEVEEKVVKKVTKTKRKKKTEG